jgi:anthranilate synthase component 1
MQSDTLKAHARAGYGRVPLVKALLADLDTPLSTYLKLAAAAGSYLFESVQGGEQWGRYSIIGLPCRRQYRIYGHQVETWEDGACLTRQSVDDPLAWVEHRHRAVTAAPPEDLPGLPRFLGGLVGYFGYDTIRYIEPRLAECPNPDPLGVPDILLMESDEVLVFDNLAGRLYLIVNIDPGEADALAHGEARLEALAGQLREEALAYARPAPPRAVAEEDFDSSIERDDYLAMVGRIRQYIVDGDCMQVVPSRRMSADYGGRPLDLYRALRCTNPSPYLFYLDFGDFQVVGSSPEILARLEDGEATVRPIAGTRRRGGNRDEDQALEAELLADPKERAEHLMLIDLGRNDIGRVSEVGSVRLTDQMTIERYSHVMHIVSNVTGTLREGLGPMDLLRATHPAGTLSGAPKIRAMEIIDEVEPVKRGVYGGAVGYLSWSGNMDTAIAIRTAVIKDGRVHVQAGGGVVHDSDPAAEWEETVNKGRALFRAVAMAEAGLDGP